MFDAGNILSKGAYMKKIISGIIAVLTLMFIAVPEIAKADVLWEPQKDFFGDNNIATTIEKRTYIANSPNGFINIYKSPDSSATVGSLSNGEAFYVYYKGEYNGKLWGMSTDENYIILEDVYVKYDHISFEEEYKDKIVSVSDQSTVELKKGYIYMSYPGADTYSELTFDNKEAYPSAYFTDEDGHEWAYFGYVYGLRNFWVCMDDPYNKDYRIREIATHEVHEAVTPTEAEIKAVAKEENNVNVLGTRRGKLIVVACICTASVAALAIFMITRKINTK